MSGFFADYQTCEPELSSELIKITCSNCGKESRDNMDFNDRITQGGFIEACLSCKKEAQSIQQMFGSFVANTHQNNHQNNPQQSLESMFGSFVATPKNDNQIESSPNYLGNIDPILMQAFIGMPKFE
jgi:hypothetical protein